MTSINKYKQHRRNYRIHFWEIRRSWTGKYVRIEYTPILSIQKNTYRYLHHYSRTQRTHWHGRIVAFYAVELNPFSIVAYRSDRSMVTMIVLKTWLFCFYFFCSVYLLRLWCDVRHSRRCVCMFFGVWCEIRCLLHFIECVIELALFPFTIEQNECGSFLLTRIEGSFDGSRVYLIDVNTNYTEIYTLLFNGV